MEKTELRDDSELLAKLAKECKDINEKERLRALYALSIGHSIPKIAEIFCVDESAIYRWIKQWKHGKNISNKSKPGRPHSLDENDKNTIKNLITEKNPKKHGINASFWDCKELQMYFSKKGKNVSKETLRKTLRSMGAHYIKANLEYAEADKKEQKRFAQEFFSEMQTKPKSAVLLFQDEMSANCSARKGYGWTFEKRLVVKAPQKSRRRTNCFGAVNPIDGQITLMTSESAKADAFIKFLGKLESKYCRKKIWIYLDNLRVHKSKMVNDFLKKHNRIKLKFLPPYSPNLNLQEQWWNYIRKKLLNNRSFDNLRKLSSAIGWFGKKATPEQIKSVCSFACLEKLMQ